MITVDRTVRLLDELARAHAPLPLKILATRTELPTATVHRLLQALLRTGHVSRSGRLGYRLGAAANVIASGALRTWGPARELLHDLVTELGETAVLAVLAGHDVLLTVVVDSPRSMRIDVHTGDRLPALGCAAGRMLLSPPGLRKAGDITRWTDDEEGICSLAAPLPGSGLEIAVSVLLPAVRFSATTVEVFRSVLGSANDVRAAAVFVVPKAET